MKIFLLTVSANRMHISRKELFQTIISQGHELVVIGPDYEKESEANLSPLGVQYIGLPMHRTSMNIFSELKMIRKLYRLFKKEKPDAVISYGMKMGLSGNLTAFIAGIKNIFPVFNGTGSLFQMKGMKAGIIKRLIYPWIKFTLSKCKIIFFQNPDDRDLFLQLNLIKEEKTFVVNGSGVNIEKFQPTKLPDEPVFLLVARLVREKGILEYIKAASIVKQEYPQARFRLLGAFDQAVNAINQQDLDEYIDQGVLEYLGTANPDDVITYYENTSFYVLPSYYREGIPRTILEAMAMGRPIITTDSPGCRETVEEGINGFLVPPRDVQALAEKMKWLIQQRQKSNEMGNQSRKMCEEKFDVNEVNAVMLRKMGLI